MIDLCNRLGVACLEEVNLNNNEYSDLLDHTK